jgi:hypothetical protein
MVSIHHIAALHSYLFHISFNINIIELQHDLHEKITEAATSVAKSWITKRQQARDLDKKEKQRGQRASNAGGKRTSSDGLPRALPSYLFDACLNTEMKAIVRVQFTPVECKFNITYRNIIEFDSRVCLVMIVRLNAMRKIYIIEARNKEAAAASEVRSQQDRKEAEAARLIWSQKTGKSPKNKPKRKKGDAKDDEEKGDGDGDVVETRDKQDDVRITVDEAKQLALKQNVAILTKLRHVASGGSSIADSGRPRRVVKEKKHVLTSDGSGGRQGDIDIDDDDNDVGDDSKRNVTKKRRNQRISDDALQCYAPGQPRDEDDHEDDEPPVKRTKLNKKKKINDEDEDDRILAAEESIPKEPLLFSGITFFMTGNFKSTRLSRKEVKKLIIENGGRVEAAITPAVTHLLTSDIRRTIKSTKLAIEKKKNPVSLAWVEKCLRLRRFVRHFESED